MATVLGLLALAGVLFMALAFAGLLLLKLAFIAIAIAAVLSLRLALELGWQSVLGFVVLLLGMAIVGAAVRAVNRPRSATSRWDPGRSNDEHVYRLIRERSRRSPIPTPRRRWWQIW
jgi:hypothetical protein